MRNTIRIVAASLMLALAVPGQAQKSAGDVADDSTIAATIKAGLLDNQKTHAGRINVESYKGVVQLSGFVETEAEKEAAGKVAKGVSGVREVNNSIAAATENFVGHQARRQPAYRQGQGRADGFE